MFLNSRSFLVATTTQNIGISVPTQVFESSIICTRWYRGAVRFEGQRLSCSPWIAIEKQEYLAQFDVVMAEVFSNISAKTAQADLLQPPEQYEEAGLLFDSTEKV